MSRVARCQCTQSSRHLRRVRRLSRAALATAPRLSRPVPQRPWAVRVRLPSGPVGETVLFSHFAGCFTFEAMGRGPVQCEHGRCSAVFLDSHHVLVSTHFVDQLHLLDDVLTPRQQARLHQSPSSTTDLPLRTAFFAF